MGVQESRVNTGIADVVNECIINVNNGIALIMVDHRFSSLLR